MATETAKSRNQDWDTVNSILCAGVYFNNQLKNYKTGNPMYTKNEKGILEPCKYQKRFFKPMNDTKYNTGKSPEDIEEAIRYEVSGFIRCLLVFKKDGNDLKKALLYSNHNAGNKNGGDNVLIATLQFHGNNFKVEYSPKCYPLPRHKEILDETFEVLRKML
jgi:hypothetical protein